MPTVKNSQSWSTSVIERLYNAIRRGRDVSRNVVLNGALTPLFSEKCVSVTLINTTGEDMSFSVNNTASITLPDKTGVTLDVDTTDQISVAGLNTLSYIVSK
jgi:hypothetical protein